MFPYVVPVSTILRRSTGLWVRAVAATRARPPWLLCSEINNQVNSGKKQVLKESKEDCKRRRSRSFQPWHSSRFLGNGCSTARVQMAPAGNTAANTRARCRFYKGNTQAQNEMENPKINWGGHVHWTY